MKQELICITCPIGCHLDVELENGEILSVSGNQCKRGSTYAKEEMIAPKRSITSTVKINNAIHKLLPVTTSKAIDKEKIFLVMEEIRKIEVSAPISMKQVIIKNVCGTDVDIIASRDMEKLD